MHPLCNTKQILSFTDTSLLGAGVAHIDTLAVFCPGAVAGDTAEIEITEVRKNYANARLVRLIDESPGRIPPDCGIFGRCGGCLFRHIRYTEEARLKEKAVHAALRRTVREECFEPIFCDTPSCYRNKVVFHLDEEFRHGYYAAQSHAHLYPADGRCHLHPEIFDRIAVTSAAILRTLSEKSSFRFCALGLRRAESGQCTAVLYAQKDTPDALSAAKLWAKALTEEHPEIIGAFYGSGAPEDGDTRIRCLCGEGYLSDRFLSLTLRISPAAFYQVNHAVAERLCETAAEFAALQPGETAADLYCGTGTIGLTLASLSPAAQVVGIEINESAVRDAEANAKLNHLQNIRFRCGDSATAERDGLHFDCIVIDPPRKGCSPEMLEALVRLNPARIVYVSCNPATLARDAAELAKAGWQITRAKPFDMFPRTGHVETVVCLTRK